MLCLYFTSVSTPPLYTIGIRDSGAAAAPPVSKSLVRRGHTKQRMCRYTAPTRRKLRVLCFHGFRTSGRFLEKQIQRWDSTILDLLDLTVLDAPFPAQGKSEIEDLFPPPYYEWFQFNVIFTDYVGLDECIAYVSDYMEKHGPFDGLLGFSQGAVLSAALAGLQQKGLALVQHPPLRFVVIISGALLKNEQLMKDCYSEQIKCPSLHFIGANDWLKPKNEEVLKVFDNPVVIRHQAKHIVPRLGEEAVVKLRSFLSTFLGGCESIPMAKASINEENTEEMWTESEVTT